MDRIVLQDTLPLIFQNEAGLNSEVWLKCSVFERGHNYLIEANSGTGKSSLCSYIYGYRSDYLGQICFDDRDVRELEQKQWDAIRCRELSLLFQELSLFPELTAMENVLLKNNLTGYKTETQIKEMFDILNISEKKDTYISKMSWGQQQRVAVIRCLCQPFSFIVLDEPISHLDEGNAAIMADLIQKEAEQQGAGIIATSIGKHLPLSYTKTLAL